MGFHICNTKFVWHIDWIWLNTIGMWQELTQLLLCMVNCAAMNTLSVMKHKGSTWNGRLDCSSQMEFFSLMIKWNMKLRTGFSSWNKTKNLDENQVLDKKQTKPTKRLLTPPQPINPESKYMYQHSELYTICWKTSSQL